MGRKRLSAISVAYVLVLASIAGAPLAFGSGTAAAANTSTAGPTYAVGQAGQCLTAIQPLGNGSLAGPEYYDYRSHGEEYASHGTTDVQESDVSQVYLYNGSDGTSLVLLHDALGDEENGGAATFNVTGLPADGEWTVEDDDYEGRDDVFNHTETYSELNWMWGPNRTDGAVFSGLEPEESSEITIDPAFKEESYAHQNGWDHSTEGPNEWKVRDRGDETAPLDMTRRISIRPGDCSAVSPTAALSGPDNATAGTAVTLEASAPDSPTTPYEYEWDFEDDGEVDRTTTAATVDHNYSEAGEVTAAVRVVDRFGQSATATTTITIEATEAENEPPTAAFDVNETTPDVGQPIAVDASNSSDDTGIASYEWDFGDGATASGETAAHAYGATGDYTVTLTVTDGDGANDTATETVAVAADGTAENSPPTVDLTADPGTVTAGEAVALEATASDPDGDSLTYTWEQVSGPSELDLPEGSDGTVTPTDAGDHEVSVTVEDPDGANASASVTVEVVAPNQAPSASFDWSPTDPSPGESITFDATTASDPDGTISSYAWDFDADGTADADGEQATHAFEAEGNYDVTLTVADDEGATATSTETVSVGAENSPPTVDLTADPTTVTVGDDVTLVADATDPDDDSLNYTWELLDGPDGLDLPSDEGGTVAPTDAGTYEVAVTVADAGGAEATDTASIEVSESAEAPTAAFDWSPTEPATGEPVTLDASASSDPDGSIEHYEWDIDDDGSYEKTGSETAHTFDAQGSYPVTLRVTDDQGRTDMTTGTIEVAASDSDENSPPDAVLSANVTSIKAGQSVALDASDSSDPDGPDGALSFDWAIVSAPSDASLPTFESAPANHVTFDTPGTYEVEVTVEDGDGGADSATEKIEVAGKAHPHIHDITIDDETVEVAEETRFEVTVHNDGTASAEKALEIVLDGEVVETRTIEIGPGEWKTVTLIHCFKRPGNFSPTVAGQSFDVEVYPPTHSLEGLTVDGDDSVTVDAESPGTVTASAELIVETDVTSGETLATALESLDPTGFTATIGGEAASVTNVSAGDPQRQDSSWVIPLSADLAAPANDPGSYDLRVAFEPPDECWPIGDSDCDQANEVAVTGEDVFVYESAAQPDDGGTDSPPASTGPGTSSGPSGGSGLASSGGGGPSSSSTDGGEDAEEGTPTPPPSDDGETVTTEPTTSEPTPTETSSPSSPATPDETETSDDTVGTSTTPATPTATAETESFGQPGFGVALSVLALLGAALLARYRP